MLRAFVLTERFEDDHESDEKIRRKKNLHRGRIKSVFRDVEEATRREQEKNGSSSGSAAADS